MVLVLNKNKNKKKLQNKTIMKPIEQWIFLNHLSYFMKNVPFYCIWIDFVHYYSLIFKLQYLVHAL